MALVVWMCRCIVSGQGVKGQKVLFVLRQASYRLWIALSILGFEGGQLSQCFLLCRLPPDTNEFGLDVATLSSGDRIQDVALFMQQAALTRGRCKQFRDGCQQSVVTVSDDEINLGRSPCSQVLQEARPSIFVLLGAGAQSEYFLVSCQINAQGRQDDRGIGLLPMTNAEMHPVQIDNAPVALQRTLPPCLILLGEALVEPTDGTGTGSYAQQGFSHFPDLMGTHSGYEHLGQAFGNVRFIATKPLKCLSVKPTFPISGYVDILNTTCGCHQITTVGAIAIAFPFRAAFSPRCPNERI